MVTIAFVSGCGGDSGSTPTAPPTPPAPVATSITLSSTSVTLDAIGKTAQLSASVKDQNGATMAGKTITWATSDAAIVSVSSSGLVTAISPGTANITATHQSLSATASVITKDEASPEVTMFSYDDLEVTFEPGVLELYGATKIGVTVQDDYQLKKIAVYLHIDGVDVELSSDETLSGTTGTYFFNWNTYETTTVGGVDTLWAKVWDTSDNEGVGAQEIVLMHQPLVTVNNLLLRPVTVLFQTKDRVNTYLTDTVAKNDTSQWRATVLSTDSLSVVYSMQREPRPDWTGLYLGEELNAYFNPAAPNTNLTYEIDNVIGEKTYYYPQFSNATNDEAYPYIDIGLTGEQNICYWNALYSCSVAPGAVKEDYGFYELKTTSRPGYRKRGTSGWPVGTSYYWTYESIKDYVQTGSGALSLSVTWPSGDIAAGDFVGDGTSLPSILIEPLRGPHPRRIPGAITDDRPLPRGR